MNIDVTLYHGGFHGDLNETYYVGEKALADPDSVKLVECTRQALDLAIDTVKPGTLFRDFGNIIEKHAKPLDCSVIKTYCGHGINQLFHCAPNIPHYAKNKAVGACKPGMCFTIEPMIALGSWRDKTWPDDWTSVTVDGKRTAQFGEFMNILHFDFHYSSEDATLPFSKSGGEWSSKLTSSGHYPARSLSTSTSNISRSFDCGCSKILENHLSLTL